MENNSLCKWLHENLEDRPLIQYPFDLEDLPKNGIYFFYEKGEFWGHDDSKKPRIVRVGTHRKDNFRSRISQHFLVNNPNIKLCLDDLAPKNRSIFRKNLGRAILSLEKSKYLSTWDIDFTSRNAKDKLSHLRDIDFESETENKISFLLKDNFSFRYIKVESQKARIGSKGLESSLVGTLSHCQVCLSSPNWLGRYSPVKKIRESGLWQVQHLNDNPISDSEKDFINKIP